MHLASVRGGHRVSAPLAAILLLATLGLAPAVGAAQTWTETGDAGNLIGSAQTTAGSGALTAIAGTLTSDSDVDVYCIRVVDPANFFAARTPCVAFADPDLFLFASNGDGVSHNDGCQGGQTRVGAPLVPSAGTYYLAITGNDGDALNGALPIWDPALSNTGERAPDGTGAPGPLSGWGGARVVPPGQNNYTLVLQGAEFCDAPVPGAARSFGMVKGTYQAH